MLPEINQSCYILKHTISICIYLLPAAMSGLLYNTLSELETLYFCTAKNSESFIFFKKNIWLVILPLNIGYRWNSMLGGTVCNSLLQSGAFHLYWKATLTSHELGNLEILRNGAGEGGF